MPNEVWIRNPCDRYYPLYVLKHLITNAQGYGESLLVLEADIVVDRAVVDEIASLSNDCYFLYEELQPEHPAAYERKRTMSMFLQSHTVRYLDNVLSTIPESVFKSVIHSEPTFMTQLLGLQAHPTIRLRHQTHSGREVPLLGISQKSNPMAGEDTERLAQRDLMSNLARKYRPFVDAMRFEDTMSMLAELGMERVVVFGATNTTLNLAEPIERCDVIVAVVDDQRSKLSTTFCGKPLLATSAAFGGDGLGQIDGVLIVAEPENEHIFLSMAQSFLSTGVPVVSLRYGLISTDISWATRTSLQTEALAHNGYYRRLYAVLMMNSGIEPGLVTEVTGYSKEVLHRLLKLYEKHGVNALNYWVIH